MIPTEIKRALDNGITQEEIIEISTTLAFFIGWKAASEAVQDIIQVFRDLWTSSSTRSWCTPISKGSISAILAHGSLTPER